MKILFVAILIVLFPSAAFTQTLIKPGTDIAKKMEISGPRSLLNTDYMERIGEWPYGSSLSVAVDSVRDIIFLGSGGAVLILDGSNKTDPQLITDTIRTTGLVEDIFYDVATERLYLACGEGGYEIWNVEDPANPFLYSRNEINYAGAEPPVGHVQVKGDFAVFECNWGEINSVNVSDPYNPYKVDSDYLVGNPAHNVFIDPAGYVHATGINNYVVYHLDAAGHLQQSGYFPITCDAVYAKTNVSYVGSGSQLWIFYSGYYAYSYVGGLTHIEVRGDLAYIINDNGLDIWDVSDYTSPIQLSSTPIDIFPKDLYVAGTYAYVANDAHGLKIYDVRNPSAPLLAGSYETYSVAIHSCIKDSIAYVTHYDDGLLMIDISNREYPLLIGQYPTAAGHIEDIKIRDNLAVLTCYEDGLRIIDISDPVEPIDISHVPGFNAWLLDINENYAYVEEVYPPNTTANIRIFDISDPYNPAELGSIFLPSYAWSFTYHNGHLYVADYEQGFKIINVSDPQNPYIANTIQLPDVFDVYIKGDDAYVCADDWPVFDGGLHIYDISDPEAPVEKGYYGVPGFSPMDVAVVDSFAYVGTGDDIWLFKLTDTDPVFLDQFRFPDIISDIVPVDQYLYISNSKAGLSIYRNNLIANPVSTIWEFQISGITGNIWAVYFTSLINGWAAAQGGKLLHTTDGGNNWEILQVGDPYLDDFMDLTFVNENTGWVCGANGSMFRTTDGGQNWIELNVPVPATTNVRGMSFLNDTLGWFVALDQFIYKTTDGGQSWIQQNSGLTGWVHNINVCFTDENNGFVTGFILNGADFEGYILKTTNGGQSWTADFNYQNQNPDPIFFSDQNTGWIGGSNGFLIKTTDGGETWQNQSVGSVEITNLFFISGNDGWLTGFGGALYQTADGGNSWLQHNVLIQGIMRSVYFADDRNGWAVGDNGIILHTGDGTIPVELTNFSASMTWNKVILNWTTRTEMNNKGFEVERSARSPGTDWEKIGFVGGSGTKTEPESYTFTDNFPGENILPGTYSYRLKQIDYNGTFRYSKEIQVSLTIPGEFSLQQNYPNPYNSATTIRFSIPAEIQVTLTVFDMLGEKVKDLKNEVMKPGYYEVDFNSSALSSGVYFYRIRAGDPSASSGQVFIQTKKMVLLK